ncbi:MAG: TM0106 family RecB-like putative nuclease [candidate division WOR-3 bacterium]
MEILRDLGVSHEQSHRDSLQPVLDLSAGMLEKRFQATIKAIQDKIPVIYQPVFITGAPFSSDATIIGIPDFLIFNGDGYIIRDCKISRTIDESRHPEIIKQMCLYGWLYERVIGQSPISLEVFSGQKEIISLDFIMGQDALADLEEIYKIQTNGFNGYEPVGWSKCSSCPYFNHCWNIAVRNRDSAILPGVDQGLARTLVNQGITTYDDLLKRYTEETLYYLQRPWGNGQQMVGKSARSILSHAKAFQENKIIKLSNPRIPNSNYCVMFDIEGLPPQLDDTEKIYLWGLMLCNPPKVEVFQPLAGFGPDGDKHGWDDFLQTAQSIFNTYGDIPYVHWHSYEKAKIKLYIDRYGDNSGIAARILENLCDLHSITKTSVVMPEPSYSIKVIEKRVGYQRTMDDYGGRWSMAQYIKAVETEDQSLRQQMIDKILVYNREDLEATWAVLQWLHKICKTPPI